MKSPSEKADSYATRIIRQAEYISKLPGGPAEANAEPPPDDGNDMPNLPNVAYGFADVDRACSHWLRRRGLLAPKGAFNLKTPRTKP